MVSKKIKKDLNYYLNLPWTYIIEQERDENGDNLFVIKINELPGVCSDAITIEGAFENIKEALTLAIEMSLDAKEEIPEPINEDKYQGNIAYRTTPRRHFILAKEAEKRGLSLSKVIDNLIDNTIGTSNNRK